MREIKFRGKRLDNGEWIYGSLVILNGRCFIFNDECRAEVATATVGQYTGLKDKDGKEIYEGDIVDYYYLGDNKLGLVKYHTNVFGFELFDIYGSFDYMSGYETRYYHIVGNIYDNPELFKTEQQCENLI